MAWMRLSRANVRFSSLRVCQPCITYNCHVQWRGLAESSVSHYDVLGLKPSASSSQIKSAYYQLSKKYHPDVAVGVDNAKEKFAKLSTAYEVLSSPEKRAVYDCSLHSGIGRRTTLTPDIEYRDFLRRRGTFHARTSQHAAPGAWSEYENYFRQQYYGRTMHQNWQARRNFEYRVRQNQAGNILAAVWLFFMLTGVFILADTKNNP